jgi:hypothetical protein
MGFLDFIEQHYRVRFAPNGFCKHAAFAAAHILG